MPIHTNTIDGLQFEDIRGRLQPKAEQLELIIRPGHAGETTRKTGIRAVPSQIQTVHYVASWTGAKNAIVEYNDLIGVDQVEIIQHSLSYGYFKILNVTEVEVRAVANVIGSIIVNPLALQICQWTVLSTWAPTQDP